MILTATINEVKRRILFDNPQAVVAVKGDYEVNGIAFAFPAIHEDDFDLSTAVKTVYYKATDGIIYNHVVTATDTDTGYPLWVFKDEINKGAYGDVEFALVCDKVEGGNIVKRWVSMITAFRVQKSIEIDESAQEDNEQTYSERLADLMTQMANMQTSVTTVSESASAALTKANAVDARLNNIIIESGTSEAEVVAARTNSDTGTTYNTLGARLDTEYSEIKEDLSDITGNTVIDFTVGKCIYTDGTTANITDVRTNATYAYTVTDCAEGDTFTITGRGGNAPRLWAFLGAESDGARPVLLNAIGGRVETDTYITAPENAQKLVVNVLVSVPHSLIRGEKITKRLDELSESVAIIQKEYTKLTFDVTEGKYVSGVSGGTPNDATNCATDYIRVRAGATVKAEKIIATGNRSISAYNKNKNFLRSVITGSSETKYTFVVAEDVYYIRATGATGIAPDVWISEPDIKDTETFYSASNILIPYDFRNSVNKKIVTYVDDDALDEPGLDLLKQSCDTLGIKCSIAAVGKILESTPTRVEYLKGLESQGFHICNHTYDHSRWYTDYDGQTMFTLAEVEQDLIKSIRTLDSLGFVDASKYLIYPGSSFAREGIAEVVKKWTELACTISSGNNRIQNVPRTWLHRCPINYNAHPDLAYYQTQLSDLTVEGENNWIIYYSHSKTFDESGEWNQTLFEQVMQNAMDNGYTVMTLNEAWQYRKSMWVIQEAFGR